MAEFLIYAQDFTTFTPAATTKQLAELFKLFDLVAWNADGWNWVDQERKSLVFRIISILNVGSDTCDSLLAPSIPTYDQTGLIEETYDQPRGHYLNLLDPSVSSALPDFMAWWNDATRATSAYYVPADCPLTVSSLILARPVVNVA